MGKQYWEDIAGRDSQCFDQVPPVCVAQPVGETPRSFIGWPARGPGLHFTGE